MGDQFDAVAKHARAVERLRILAETLGASIELLEPQPDGPGRLALDLLKRELERLGETIPALE